MPRYKNVDGVNVQFTAEEETARDAEEADYAAGQAGREMAQIRQHRDSLLRETDHYGLGDVTMSDDMATYRQALRDVPASNTVYADVTWPTKP